MNRQETLNKVVTFLRKQGEPAMNPVGGACYYITSDGLRCAVGCLLTADLASRFDLFDDGGVDAIFAEHLDVFRESFPDATEEDVEFLSALQDVHDQWVRSNDFPERAFGNVASIYGLAMPEVA